MVKKCKINIRIDVTVTGLIFLKHAGSVQMGALSGSTVPTSGTRYTFKLSTNIQGG